MVFWDFLKKAVLKQDCNNAKFFRLFLILRKRFIKLYHNLASGLLSTILQAFYYTIHNLA